MVKPVFCFMGPTASGKTALACELIQHFPFEIISVDSAMIYRGMDIGTAKPDPITLQAAPHHLIDILNPPESYSAAKFCEDVDILCKSILQKGKIPLLVGGTMMYFRLFQRGLFSLPEADAAVRESLLTEALAKGWDVLYQRLKKVDPVAAAKIHAHDTQRIQRALEVYILTGKPLSVYLTSDERAEKTSYAFSNLILLPADRAALHARIASRFDLMLKAGFLEEVAYLQEKWQLTTAYPSMRSVGYRQALDYLQGEYDKASLREKGIAATRQLAKRQFTWLRHWNNAKRFDRGTSDILSDLMVTIKKILDNV